MPTPQFNFGVPLFRDGAPAMAPACCCGGDTGPNAECTNLPTSVTVTGGPVLAGYDTLTPCYELDYCSDDPWDGTMSLCPTGAPNCRYEFSCDGTDTVSSWEGYALRDNCYGKNPSLLYDRESHIWRLTVGIGSYIKTGGGPLGVYTADEPTEANCHNPQQLEVQ